jgi:hypothetical protein
MAYCEANEVLEEIGSNLAFGTGTVPSEERIRDMITEHDEFIDGMARDRETVPFEPVPRIIRSISKDLTVARLLPIIYRGEGSEQHLARAKELRRFAEDRLEKIQANKLSLTATDTAAESIGGRAMISPDVPDNPIFSVQDFF